jgi:hypothetical protein
MLKEVASLVVILIGRVVPATYGVVKSVTHNLRRTGFDADRDNTPAAAIGRCAMTRKRGPI